VERVFATLRNELGWVNRGTHHATRIHDLRHNSESRIIPSVHGIRVTLEGNPEARGALNSA
jgi:hypothetical protein